ncbi:MAG: HEAT repeat domain-containing protein, partial [Akkermansiaceae bacterium]|nr:HEAT repeat domain-containing protein [Akkermansiaceae bacterium]
SGGTVPGNLTTTWNLGATGMRGWVYYDTSNGGINASAESRQIQVREVEAGSPAAGTFQPDDLILGASGTAAAPVLFGIDARRGLAAAIADAEAQTPALLKLIRWRSGTQSVVTLTLRTMGAYASTAPYNCPKSEKILLEGVDFYHDNESSGRYRLGVMSLLAADDDFFPDRALYRQKARNEARAMTQSASFLDDLRNYRAPTGYPIPWQRCHELIVLAEYYLLTGDSQVFPTIEALAINIAKGASHFGTVAHSLRQGVYDGSDSYRPVNTGYGPVNSVGMPCLLGVQLAKRCGVDDPLVDEMIERAKAFYASYAGRGAIPYGEHDPYDPRHENNGKSGLAAVVLDNDPNYTEQGEFFVMMALASGDRDRDVGHTGAFFNYLWAPLGVQRGGPPAVQEYFKQVSWLLDLHRRWDGGFDYDSYSENRAPNGSEYYGFRMSTAMLLTYAIPLESLHVTGRDSTGGLALGTSEIDECLEAEDYEASARTTSELLLDLGSWSPKVRLQASRELAGRSLDSAMLRSIRSRALDANGSAGYARYGSIQTLGEIRDTDMTGLLVSLLEDDDGYVRTLAAKALHLFAGSHKVPYREDMLTTLVSRHRPAFPADPADPLQFDQAALITAIFGGGALANNRTEMDALIADVGSDLFYDALKVASRHPSGRARGRVRTLYQALTAAEVDLLAGELVDMVALEAPADRMFSLDVRAEAMNAMQRSLVAEAVPAAMQAMDNSNGWGGLHDDLLTTLAGYGASSTLVTPDPDVVAFAQRYRTGGTEVEAQALLDAIAADTNPSPLYYFKQIDSVAPPPGEPNIFSVAHFDHAGGESIFTWRRVRGRGELVFFPNGTADADQIRYVSVGETGTYVVEVKMSDSRGFTEVTETLHVDLVAGPAPDYFEWAMGYP